jgi:hypothetical protein
MNKTHVIITRPAANDPFVYISYKPKWAYGDMMAKRIRMSTVERNNWTHRLIRCYHCKRPTVLIDSTWPYFIGGNRCEKHRNRPVVNDE